jgi:formylglycine-generating enzyme required for sulfatase activity
LLNAVWGWGLITFFVVGFGLNAPASAQVVIVPNKSNKPAPKSKARPKRAPAAAAAAKTGPRAESAAAAAKPAGRGAPSLGFAIVKPPMPLKEEAGSPSAASSGETPGPSREESGPRGEPAAASAVASASPVPAEEKAPEPKPEPATTPPAKPNATGENKLADVTAANSNGNAIGRLLGFTFEVFESDARGRMIETGRQQARYFSEDLPGGVALEMVEISGGRFMMGSPENTGKESGPKAYARDLGKPLREKVLERLPAESPEHVVKVEKFYLGKLEITQAQWRAVASLPKVKRELMSDPAEFKSGNRPVERISWEEAVEFCERLSRATGRKYRLPTEAEWEYACRAGMDTPFHFGQSISAEWANFDGKRRFLSSPESERREQTVAAGSLGIANRFGLYDMHGNVWEWCQDGWHEDYQAAPDHGGVWRESAVPYLKVVRGGGWDSAGVECRSGYRDRLTSTLRLNNLGFRVALEAVNE